MSVFPKILLVFFSGLFGVVMVLVAPPTDKAIYFYVFGAFCFAISLVCVTSGRLQEFIGSSIASCVIVVGLLYLGSELLEGPIVSGARSEPSVLNALMFLFVFGYPSFRYVVYAKFGFGKEKT